MLGVELVCVFLPQTELFVPFAAFFVAVCLVLCIFDAARKAALCILLGAAVGMASVLHTANRLERIRVQYAGRPLVLTAEVESTADSYDPGIVDAVLHVEKVNGSAASFRVECSALPECKAGERVQGRFILSAPASGSRVSLYADGIALQAEMDEDGPELTVLGESGSFRARTHRLQQRLSASLRRRMDGKTGGVLAAMTTGDRSYLSSAMRSAYRGAGLAHVLVVSGMHVSILCGDILSTLLPYEWEQSYRRRRCRAVFRSLLAFLLMGVTGFTPSVCRAAVAVWVGALGVWLYGPPDTLTSLAVAGIVMTAGNSYAVCDIGFELSFAAVVGTVAGGVCIRRARDAWYRQFWKNAKNPVKRPGYFKLPERLWGLAESICISFCASVATFPVLVLRGLSVSIYAVASSVAVLWLIQPMMLLGLGTAFAGLVPALAPLYGVLSAASAALTGLLDRWALWVSGWPGAQIYSDTAYAALVCLLLAALLGLAWHWNIRLRAAVPAVLLTAALAIGAGNSFSRDVVRVELVGSKTAPAVILSQNDRAVVLYRGGQTTRKAVETALERRSIRTVEALIDLRMDPQEPCTLRAEQTVRAARLAANTTQTLRTDTASLEVLRTQTGCAVRFTIEGQSFVTLSGTVRFAQPLEVDWLLASMARPDGVRYQGLLTRSTDYRWMDEDGGGQEKTLLSFRPASAWKSSRSPSAGRAKQAAGSS